MTLPIVHTCSCGVALNRMEWLKLPFIGAEVDDETPGAALELRKHGCGSTRSLRVSLSHAASMQSSLRDQKRKELRRVEEQSNRLTAICESQQAAGIDTHTRPL